MSLHTSINKIWIFFSWPWKRTLKDWIEKVTAWLTPFERKVKGPAPNQWTADFSLSIDWTSHHACRVKCSPSELKKELKATKKKLQQQTDASDELMKSLDNLEQYKNVKKAPHWNPWYSRECLHFYRICSPWSCRGTKCSRGGRRYGEISQKLKR